MVNQPTIEQIREALQAINAKLQEIESRAESMFSARPSDDELRVVTGIMAARLQVRQLLQVVTPKPDTLSQIATQALKDASQPDSSQQG